MGFLSGFYDIYMIVLLCVCAFVFLKKLWYFYDVSMGFL